MNRRKFLTRAALAGLGLAGAGVLDGFFIEPNWIEIERISFPVRDLPGAFEGFRVILISDTHCGPYLSPTFIEKAVALANKQQPDAVLLLGDYVHRNRSHIKPGIEPFARLHAREGVFAVLGNHDHWEGAAETSQALADAGVVELTNRCTVITRGADALAIGGVDDPWEGQPDVAAALGDVAPDVPRLLMSHTPDYAEEMPGGVRVDLILSGHTHGGQVHVPFYGAPILPSRYGQKYCAGLVSGPQCPVYVTRGLGMITPPVRFLCRPELTVMTLTQA